MARNKREDGTGDDGEQLALIDQPIGWHELAAIFADYEAKDLECEELKGDLKEAKDALDKAKLALGKAGRRVRLTAEAERRRLEGRALANRHVDLETGELDG